MTTFREALAALDRAQQLLADLRSDPDADAARVAECADLVARLERIVAEREREDTQ